MGISTSERECPFHQNYLFAFKFRAIAIHLRKGGSIGYIPMNLTASIYVFLSVGGAGYGLPREGKIPPERTADAGVDKFQSTYIFVEFSARA